MNADGSGVTRLTDRLGYDGGAFFSWDGRSIVYRAGYPETAGRARRVPWRCCGRGSCGRGGSRST